MIITAARLALLRRQYPWIDRLGVGLCPVAQDEVIFGHVTDELLDTVPTYTKTVRGWFDKDWSGISLAWVVENDDVWRLRLRRITNGRIIQDAPTIGTQVQPATLSGSDVEYIVLWEVDGKLRGRSLTEKRRLKIYQCGSYDWTGWIRKVLEETVEDIMAEIRG